MNPLSALTFPRRHKRSTFLMIVLITLATTGLYVMVAVLDSIPTRAQFIYLTRVSRVYPTFANSLEPTVVSQIRAHPDVARVIPDNGLQIAPPALIGTDPDVRLMGVSQEDLQYLMTHFGVRLKEGRLYTAHTNEILLSEEVVRALGLRVGDEIDRTINERYYGAISAPLVLVGILEGDPAFRTGPSIRVGFVSFEYLADHELFAPRVSSILVVPQEGRKEVVDDFLETAIVSPRTETETYRQVSELVGMARRGLYVIIGIVNCLVAVALALVVGMINQIALTDRLDELGLLHALGYHENRLIGRLTVETAVLAGFGWLVGLALSQLILAWLKTNLYYAKGMELNLANLAPFWFVVPILLVAIAFAAISANRVFAQFDAVAIIERGKLSTEAKAPQRAVGRSSFKPLSSRTFHRRHRRREFMLIASMSLMVLGIAFPAFLVSIIPEAMNPSIEYLRYLSSISPNVGQTIDPGLRSQVRNQPTVAHLVPAMQLGLGVLVPPGSTTQVNLLGVPEGEIPVLMDRMGLHLVEGRLPKARTNEMIVSQAVAWNRALHVGSTVGRPVQEGSEVDPWISEDIPTEIVVVGLLAEDDLWVGFASFEYLERHELTASRPIHMLVLPVRERKVDLDNWLLENVVSAQTNVNTFDKSLRQIQQTTRAMAYLFAAVEGLIAGVAAAVLAALNYIFFDQRREEFAILHAVGRTRQWLVARTVKETGGALAIAWLISAAVCALLLVFAQTEIYAPIGLTLNIFNPVPWLFTLPIPIAVLAATSGTVSRMLAKLDPISIIERRS
jgi:ABC-type lipoprotein release transport system permease subunit